MKMLMLAAGCVILSIPGPVREAAAFQEEDLTQLSFEKLAERLKTASKEERARIIKELERRGITVVEQGGGNEDDAGGEAKEELRTEHFDLKGPDKATLRRKAKELEELAKKFVEIFDTEPRRGTIVFKRESGAVKERKVGDTTIQVFSRLLRMSEKGEYWTLPWPLLDEEEGGSTKELPIDPERALTHEVMHILFVKYVADKFPDLKPKVTSGGFQVGTPLPDWLDEGLAVYAEPEDFRAWRKKELVEIAEGRNALTKELLPLDDLTTMDHPITGGDGNRINVFYGQSWLLVDHLLKAAGPEVFRSLIAGLAKGRAFEELLGDAKVTGGKLPGTLKKLEEDLLHKLTEVK